MRFDRIGKWLAGLVILGAIALVGANLLERGVRELALPLRHEDVIKQQARAKGLDPYLIAAVIYQESRFRPRASSAGALGLMQILPRTARFIAQKSGGTHFEEADLATPQVNIAYGAWYLRYLLNRFDRSVAPALAAYNAGEGKVSHWISLARLEGREFDAELDIPFPETRHYVRVVLQARDRYARTYRAQLALSRR